VLFNVPVMTFIDGTNTVTIQALPEEAGQEVEIICAGPPHRSAVAMKSLHPQGDVA
jgi:hypothetical protein